MGKGSRGRLQKYCPYGKGKQGQTIEVLSLWGRGEGADYRSTVPMGEGSRGRLAVLPLWEREAGEDYRSIVPMGKGIRGRL